MGGYSVDLPTPLPAILLRTSYLEPSLVIVITVPPVRSRTILANRDFDALCRKALAQCGAFNHTRELLRTKDLEDIAVHRRQHRRGRVVQGLRRVGGADVDEIHFQTEKPSVTMV